MSGKLSDEEIVEIEMIANYPFINKLEKGNGKKMFTGIITVCNEDHDISIIQHPTHKFSFNLPAELAHFETPLKSFVEDSKPKTIVDILNTLTEKIKQEKCSAIPKNYCEKYRHVIREYSELTRFFLDIKSCETTWNLKTFKFSTVDDHKREHPLEVKVNWDSDINEIFEVDNFNLPIPKDSFKTSDTLRDIYEQFKTLIENLQPFFDLMELLDEQCWVMDPVPPQRSCKYRRIAIGENISMILTVDPLNVTHLPDIKFLGPEKFAENFRKTVNENLENWDSRNDLIVEILHLIGLEKFPSKQKTEAVSNDLLVNSGECNICFSERLNDKLPEVICNNDFCKNFYHIECLYEWLISVNSKRVFKEVIGSCPNCEKSISCPIPN